ncbi:MAG: phosphotransferase family protein [Microthrixaceae bacterium]
MTGGHSNLTFVVGDEEGGRWVLRRPPLGHVLATAHDMAREHRIISALAGTQVPVPAVVGLCEDDSVNGAPFYVMDYVQGTVVRDRATAESLADTARTNASRSLVDVLAALHRVDPDRVGVGDLGRRDGYVERTLRRWYGQAEATRADGADIDLHHVDAVHDVLVRHLPDQVGVSIVHGDYRLDNCLLHDDGSVAAVLDWELCTLGDPLADVGLLLVYWTDPGTQAVLPQASPTALAGFMSRERLLERYAEASGRDISGIDYYIALGYWKLTCIIAGVYARYAAGAMGTTDEQQVRGFAEMFDTLGAMAAEAAERIR